MARERKGVITMDTPGIKVIHTMADGSVRDSVRGYLTDYSTQLPDVAKYMLVQFILSGQKILAEEERERLERQQQQEYSSTAAGGRHTDTERTSQRRRTR